jgi:hypothetical protein
VLLSTQLSTATHRWAASGESSHLSSFSTKVPKVPIFRLAVAVFLDASGPPVALFVLRSCSRTLNVVSPSVELAELKTPDAPGSVARLLEQASLPPQTLSARRPSQDGSLQHRPRSDLSPSFQWHCFEAVLSSTHLKASS